MTEVLGIDAHGESKAITTDEDIRELAARLCAEHWKYALLIQDGEQVGGVQLDTQQHARTWWCNQHEEEAETSEQHQGLRVDGAGCRVRRHPDDARLRP